MSKEELIEAIRRCRRTRGGRRQYSEQLRSEIVEYLAQGVWAGGSFEALCQELDVNATVARRWRAARRTSGFAPVKVVGNQGGGKAPPSPPRGAAPPSAGLCKGGLTLTSPGGWQIEGLDLNGVLDLLPRLS